MAFFSDFLLNLLDNLHPFKIILLVKYSLLERLESTNQMMVYVDSSGQSFRDSLILEAPKKDLKNTCHCGRPKNSKMLIQGVTLIFFLSY